MGHCVGDAVTYWAFVARYGMHRNGYGCAPFHQLYMYSVQRSVLCHKRIIARILLSLNFHRGKEAVPAKRCLGPTRGITQPLRPFYVHAGAVTEVVCLVPLEYVYVCST